MLRHNGSPHGYGEIVGYTDNRCKQKLSDIPTKFSRHRGRAMAVAAVTAISGGADLGDIEKFGHRPALVQVQTAPESEEGEFVAIFDKLTDQWAARRNVAAKQVVQRHLKIVS